MDLRMQKTKSSWRSPKQNMDPILSRLQIEVLPSTHFKCCFWAQDPEIDGEKERGKRELLCSIPAWQQEKSCWERLQERGSAVILFHFRTQNLKRFFLEMCNGTVRKQTTPLPSSFLLKSFKASHGFHLCRHWELISWAKFFFFFSFNGIQAKMKCFKKNH